MALAALRAGKDVFVEKPLTLDWKDGLEMVETSCKLGRILMVGHTCKEVAAELTLSVHTVQHYIERLKLRLGQKTLHGLVSFLGRGEPSLLSYMANGGGDDDMRRIPLALGTVRLDI